jgi:2,4-dichlorophenol 6-monooxygenase
MYAENVSNGRVYCMGDAIHRHPPSNGLGSNTSIQDAFNLAWKLAYVLKGNAGEKLLDSYQAERAPVAKQIVTRANKSIEEFGPIFKALGLLDSIDPVKMQSNMDARCDPNEAGEAQRRAIREAIAGKIYEFDAHGVEMNQRYKSGAIQTDGQPEPAFEEDAELHFQQTTWPGARVPHAWVYSTDGGKVSTLDLSGHGKFTVLTGLRGQEWVEAAATVGKELGIEIAVHIIGPRQKWQDLAGDWARASEIEENGAVLVRPDHHVAWRTREMPGNPEAELRRALKDVLALA